jgi:hypothetical protein
MKTIYKINSVVLISAALLICSAAVAQEKYNTAERVGKQLKQNSVPGLKYGPEPQLKQGNEPVDPKRDTKGNIRDILFTGGIPATTEQTLKTNRPALAKSAQSALPSDAKLPEPDQKKTEAPKLPPMQTEEKRAN